MSPEAERARHEIANVLFRYVEIADRKDVDAVVDLLGRAQVQFPAGGSADPDGAREFFTGLWSAQEGHRHDVTNLIVDRDAQAGMWRANAHYTRWVLPEGAPFLHTLGQYELLVDGTDWSVRELTVRRVWAAGA